MQHVALLLVLPLIAVQEKLSQDEIHAFIKKLGSESIEEREQAFGDLMKLGKRTVPLLEEATRADDKEIAGRAKDILRLMMLGERQELLRLIAADALEDIGAKEAIPRLIELTQDPESKARAMAINALRKLQAQEAIPNLVILLDDREGDIRARAAWALAILDARKNVPEISGLLSDDKGFVRGFAARSLAELDATEKVDEITALLTDEDWQARLYAVRALGKLGDKSVAPSVVELLKDEDALVRRDAATVLGALGGRETCVEVYGLLRDKDRGVRAAAASALCGMGYAAGVPILLRDSTDYFALNGIRRPGVWRKMMGTRVGRDVEGSFERIVNQLAQRCRMGVQWTRVTPRTEYCWNVKDRLIRSRRGKASVFEAIQESLKGDFGEAGPYEAILETDRIRIVTRLEARTFWNRWWRVEQKKQSRK